jgi:hypothetical protein
MTEQQRINIRSERTRRARVRSVLDRRARQRGFASEADRIRQRDQLLDSIEAALQPKLTKEVLSPAAAAELAKKRRKFDPRDQYDRELDEGADRYAWIVLLIVLALFITALLLPPTPAVHRHDILPAHSEGLR